MGNFDDTYAPGVTLTACYADGAAVNEERFQIAWYTSESRKDSEFSAIAGATDVTYKITTAEGGKYIKAGITPIFSYETNEDLEFYSQTRYIELRFRQHIIFIMLPIQDLG